LITIIDKQNSLRQPLFFSHLFRFISYLILREFIDDEGSFVYPIDRAWLEREFHMVGKGGKWNGQERVLTPGEAACLATQFFFLVHNVKCESNESTINCI
jgi:hypothetical protein